MLSFVIAARVTKSCDDINDPHIRQSIEMFQIRGKSPGATMSGSLRDDTAQRSRFSLKGDDQRDKAKNMAISLQALLGCVQALQIELQPASSSIRSRWLAAVWLVSWREKASYVDVW